MPITSTISDLVFSRVVTRAAIKLTALSNKTMMELESYALGTVLQGTDASALIFGGESIVANNILEAFRTQFGRIMTGTVDEAWGEGKNAVRLQGDQSIAERWQLDPRVAKHCPDCLARANEVRTREEWDDVGGPQSGFSVCGSNCKCILVPTSTPSFFA